MIRGSQDADEARGKLMKQFKLSEIQANHILDMPLRRLTRLARRARAGAQGPARRIRHLKGLLKDPKKIRALIQEELLEIKKKYADPRRTQLRPDEGDLDVQDLIAEEDVVITVSRAGYVKRQPIENSAAARAAAARGSAARTSRKRTSSTTSSRPPPTIGCCSSRARERCTGSRSTRCRGGAHRPGWPANANRGSRSPATRRCRRIDLRIRRRPTLPPRRGDGEEDDAAEYDSPRPASRRST